MSIHRLKETVINRIAAGEVVERPASAVKELVENAIDSGADKIEIALEGGGKSLIRVADNGGGIAETELELAVSRHCTSKITDDIFDIRALGFRGEALPSIASVAHLRLASRQSGAAAGAEICLSGGAVTALRPAALNTGTIAEVRDLFYATPARLKFLKSDQAEAAAASDAVKRLALAFPHIRFILSGGGRMISDFSAAPLISGSAGNEAAALRRRLTQILGREAVENCLELSAGREGARLSGFISIPSYHRGNALQQFLYVNGRPVRDRHLSAALRAAYADMLPAGRFCLAALFLRLDPQLVDVNVHPAKADVRFRDSGLIRGLIIGAVRQTLSQAGLRPSSAAAYAFMRAAEDNSAARGAAEAAFASRSAALSVAEMETAPAPNFKTLARGFDEAGAPPLDEKSQTRAFAAPSADWRGGGRAAEMSAAAAFPLGAAKTQLFDNYIIAQTESSLVVVDQHAAHERLVYEALKQALYAKPLAAQMLLIPEIVELPPEDAARLAGCGAFLARFGLEIESFGNNALMVRAVPALLGETDIRGLIRDLADEAAEHGSADGLKKRLDYIAATMACHGSVRSGRRMRPEEMNALLRQMEQVPESGTCNHGRPTFIELKLSDIEKLFSRR